MPSRPAITRSDAFDVAVAAFLGALGVASLVLGGDPDIFAPHFADYARPAGAVLLAGCIAPLAVRRRYPLAVLVVVVAALIPLRVIEVPEFTASALAVYLVFYTAGAYGGPRRAAVLAITSIALGALLVWDIVRSADDAPDGQFVLVTTFSVAVNVVQITVAWFLGENVRRRREREVVLEQQAAALQEAAVAEARQAVLGERVRIARELHDVLAHHVSVMGVQAAAARRVLDQRPAAVPELLTNIESSSREAVTELQRLLGLLRQDDDVDVDAPQPTLAGLTELAAQLGEAGVEVAVDVDLGEGDPVPPAIALSAYRIVQEALTNTLKHAGPGHRAQVRVCRRPSSLEVEVIDDGTATVRRAGGSTGHGLIGMRERVKLHGGELKVGRRAGTAGFEVRAWFPL